MISAGRYDVVIPTVGRPSLAKLLDALGRQDAEGLGRVVIVDDRHSGLAVVPPTGGPLAERVVVVRGAAAGPAAARNTGWRATASEWVAFLDDDVVPPPDWTRRLLADLDSCGPDVAATQGRIRVPLPAVRRATDWERNVSGLEHARWATADMAFRRAVLDDLGGFDERFPRAYREDVELGLRVVRAGHRIAQGSRVVDHPVRPASRWVSLRLQAGNQDDALMRALHGRRWREEAGVPPGRRSRHLATAVAGLASVVARGVGRPRAARLAALAWLGGTAELTWARVVPGPRTASEISTMVVTSVAMPFAASWHWLRGLVRARRLARPPDSRPEATPTAQAQWPAAVLLDRDGTLVIDVPYNGDPALVRPAPGAKEAVARLREAGIPIAVITNQSGVGRGILTADQVESVNRRVDELLGPLGPWLSCLHGPDEGCDCRKPAPGLVLRAARALGVPPERCAVVGDIGADVEAARAAGARGVLVPTEATRPEEIASAAEVAPDLPTAVDLLLGGRQ